MNAHVLHIEVDHAAGDAMSAWWKNTMLASPTDVRCRRLLPGLSVVLESARRGDAGSRERLDRYAYMAGLTTDYIENVDEVVEVVRKHFRAHDAHLGRLALPAPRGPRQPHGGR